MGYWNTVKQIVAAADIVVEVVDSRFPQKSRIQELEEMVARQGKKLLVAINKADLVSKREAEKQKRQIGNHCVFVSAKKRQGVAMLRTAIRKLSEGKEVKVAVVGYPNTGKSSIINMLKGRKAARTSSIAGFTRGKQFVRIDNKVMLVDSPGIIPPNEKDEALLVLLSAKNFQHLHDLESTAADVADSLLASHREEVLGTYGVEATDGEELLQKIAIARNKLVKGGKPDVNAAARILLTDFQEGKLYSYGKRPPAT